VSAIPRGATDLKLTDLAAMGGAPKVAFTLKAKGPSARIPPL
jgi:hypothetical protein